MANFVPGQRRAAGVGWFIRMNVAESPDFEKIKICGEKVKVSIAVVCRDHMREILIVIGARLAEVTWFYTIASFALAYATTSLHIPKTTMLNATIWGAAVVFFTIPLFGYVGYRIGQKWVFMVGAIGILACGPLFFDLLATRDPLDRRRDGPRAGRRVRPSTVRRGTYSRASFLRRSGTRASRSRCKSPERWEAAWPRSSPPICSVMPTAIRNTLRCMSRFSES
jgi:hypothetical protein